MSVIARSSDEAVAFELLNRLVGGIDPETIDGFIDDVLSLAARLKHVRCRLSDDSSLRLESQNLILCEATAPRAKTKLRMICARLAARCATWSNRQVSPYGDVVELEAIANRQMFKVSFENTASAQWFLLEPAL